ncbi:hypothetical protein RBWH47_01183 [Rhodopirellula baltica WH47]|uniref:Uncharacterized protein n=2 Tax=Rhodopirellula baltica TaxID=265606 RepID=F2AQB5_RHOBT|nr:hypothetical protein RBWH47_01183 [Rhodopirellula baltica WH47]
MANQIAKNETVELESPDGDTIIAIQMALDIDDLGSVESFVAEAAQAFLMQRMISPAETNGLLISVMGKMQPDEFAVLWMERVAADEALTAFMDRMDIADVMGFMRDNPDQPVGVSLVQS